MREGFVYPVLVLATVGVAEYLKQFLFKIDMLKKMFPVFVIAISLVLHVGLALLRGSFTVETIILGFQNGGVAAWFYDAILSNMKKKKEVGQ